MKVNTKLTPQELSDLNTHLEEYYKEDSFLLPAILHTESNNLALRKNRVTWRTSRQERDELQKEDEKLLILIRFIAEKLEERKEEQ